MRYEIADFKDILSYNIILLLISCLSSTLSWFACSGSLCLQIKPDLSNYDESQAWPLLLDNYVEWARKCMLTMSWSRLHSRADLHGLCLGGSEANMRVVWSLLWEMGLFLVMFTAFRIYSAVYNFRLYLAENSIRAVKSLDTLYGSTSWIVATCYGHAQSATTHGAGGFDNQRLCGNVNVGGFKGILCM